jgi:hypothetical protein
MTALGMIEMWFPAVRRIKRSRLDFVWLASCAALLLGAFTPCAAGAQGLPTKAVTAHAANGHWPAAVQTALARAGTNREELQRALRGVAAAQREGMEFLIANMPDSDLRTLSAKFLVENVALAYQAYDRAPWKDRISKALFLNDILPYCCLNEARDGSRKFLLEKAAPLVADCRTPAEAAQRLNEKLFPLLHARYSTERKRPDQSPLETVESGKATCSGLSILLAGACRAVGVPARVAGTPLWANLSGNHTWVEVWDEEWHFTGAAEPDPNGLDRGWFTGNAALARKDVPQHAIYASSFAKTGLSFPLVWAPDLKWVPAVNVTDRYTPKTAATADSGKAEVLVKVLDAQGKRIAAQVTLRDLGSDGKAVEGVSKAGTADLNDMLAFPVYRTCPPRRYEVVAVYAGHTARCQVTAGAKAQEIVLVKFDPVGTPLERLLADRFGSDPARQAAAQTKLAALPASASARALAWQSYKASPQHAKLAEEWQQKSVSTADRTSPYLWRTVGTKPSDGWALVIAMHGGGGVPKELNDREWDYMYRAYYHEHPEAGGYVYLALRAPNDAWNGFYDDSICPLVENLIKQFVLFADVNPDKVYTLGASHGGYGAFVIGPKIPYRFAAVHASASAPSGGETRGENLRNVRFTFMVGEKDTDYGRAGLCQKFALQVEEWRKQYGGFPGELELEKGTGHFVPDHDKLAEMLKFQRDAWPKSLVWTQSDSVLPRFYWIEASHPTSDGHIEASVTGNTITIKATKQDRIGLWLDQSLIDLKKPVMVEVVGGKRQVYRLKPNLETYCLGLDQTADPHLAAPVRISVPLVP